MEKWCARKYRAGYSSPDPGQASAVGDDPRNWFWIYTRSHSGTPRDSLEEGGKPMAQKSPNTRPSRVSIFHTEPKISTRHGQRPTVLSQVGGPRLSVVTPTRNEAGNVAVLQQRLAEALAGIDHEIIIVDDSNDDVSRPALATAAEADPSWRVIERSGREQTGLGSAVIEGLRVARGDAVCVRSEER